MTSRDLHDMILRALCDAPFRLSLWDRNSVAEVPSEWLRKVDRAGMERFARFLTRHYYRERIVHFFKYSRALGPFSGRRPEDALKSEAYKSLSSRAVIGSHQTAIEMAELLKSHLLEDSGEILKIIPYWQDLIQYECTFFLADAPYEPNRRSEFPIRSKGARVVNLAWDIPSILPAILKPLEAIPMPAHAATRLLIARSRHGRVSVVRAPEVIARLLDTMDGSHDLASLASRVGVSEPEAEKVVRQLVELGAVDWPT